MENCEDRTLFEPIGIDPETDLNLPESVAKHGGDVVNQRGNVANYREDVANHQRSVINSFDDGDISSMIGDIPSIIGDAPCGFGFLEQFLLVQIQSITFSHLSIANVLCDQCEVVSKTKIYLL